MSTSDQRRGTILERRKTEIGINPQSADHGTKSDFLKNPKEGKIT